MESLARLVDESLARYGVQITVEQRWLHAEAIYGSSDEIENKTENKELETENWACCEPMWHRGHRVSRAPKSRNPESAVCS